MNTIETYEEDTSAIGRVHAWYFAYNLAKDRPLTGGGFGAATGESFARWAPIHSTFMTCAVAGPRSLGEQGFVGLGLFMLLWLLT